MQKSHNFLKKLMNKLIGCGQNSGQMKNIYPNFLDCKLIIAKGLLLRQKLNRKHHPNVSVKVRLIWRNVTTSEYTRQRLRRYKYSIISIVCDLYTTTSWKNESKHMKMARALWESTSVAVS